MAERQSHALRPCAHHKVDDRRGVAGRFDVNFFAFDGLVTFRVNSADTDFVFAVGLNAVPVRRACGASDSTNLERFCVAAKAGTGRLPIRRLYGQPRFSIVSRCMYAMQQCCRQPSMRLPANVEERITTRRRKVSELLVLPGRRLLLYRHPSRSPGLIGWQGPIQPASGRGCLPIC